MEYKSIREMADEWGISKDEYRFFVWKKELRVLLE